MNIPMLFTSATIVVLGISNALMMSADSKNSTIKESLRAENIRLEKLIVEYQSEPYIVLEHNGEHYKCYKLEEMK